MGSLPTVVISIAPARFTDCVFWDRGFGKVFSFRGSFYPGAQVHGQPLCISSVNLMAARTMDVAVSKAGVDGGRSVVPPGGSGPRGAAAEGSHGGVQEGS